MLGVGVELSYDESYYWIYSKYLDFGFFDHPPMVGLFIKIGTFVFGQTELGVRFLFLIAQALSLVLIKKISEDKNDILVMLLYCSMPLLFFSGAFALPDTPLLLFSLLFFYVLQSYLKEDSAKNTFLLSFIIAGMFYSKYHGLLIVILTICALPRLLKKKSFWIIVFLTTVLYLPHVYWQYLNDFVSFKFHLTGRVEKHFDVQNIIYFLGGQLLLFGLLSFVFCFKKLPSLKKLNDFDRVLFFNSIGFLVFLFFMSFRNQIEANWTISACAAFIILCARQINKTKIVKITSLPSIIIILFGFFTLLNPQLFMRYIEIKDNRLNEITSWKNERIPVIKDICESRVIVGDNYQISSKLSFYLNESIPAIHKKSRDSHYSLLNLEKKIKDTEEVCYLTSALRYKSIRVETFFKDPIYIIPKIAMGELRE